MSDKDDKNPYGKYSIEDVVEAESGNYYIQMGADCFETEAGKMAFTKDRAEQFLNTITKGLVDLQQNGSEVEKKDATLCLNNLRIVPLRIH